MLKIDWPIWVLFWVFLLGGALHEAVSAEPQSSATPPASSGQQPALNRMQALDYAILPGGKLVIKLVFRHELREPPAVFASYHPTARIVLDFADTASETGKDLMEVGQGGLRSLQVVQAGTRTRLVINLARPVVYETALKGNELLITLQRPQAGTTGDVRRWFPNAEPAAPRHNIREVTFQRAGWDGVFGHDFSAKRCHVRYTTDGFGVFNTASPTGPLNTQILGCIVENLVRFSPDLSHTDGTHNDCVQVQGGSGLIVRGNLLSSYLDPDRGNTGGLNRQTPSHTTGNAATRPVPAVSSSGRYVSRVVVSCRAMSAAIATSSM